MARDAVLVMAYGTPEDIDDVERYYTHIRHGRPPPAALLEDLRRRYLAIGGRSPLREVTEAQREGIEKRLDGIPTYLGFKHSAPFIADAVAAIERDGIDRVVGLVLAPHYSAMGIGDYTRRAQRAAADLGWSGRLRVVESWHLEPGFIDWLRSRLHGVLASLAPDVRHRTTVVFTAHSLPAAIVQKNDPYPRQLAETAAAAARAAKLERWRLAWQSAPDGAESWLGPDVADVIRELAKAGEKGVVICPCGFVADHLEVLYDLDIECGDVAARAGIVLRRTESPNDDPEFLDVLADVVRKELSRRA